MNHLGARLILLGFGASVMILAIKRLRAYRLKERHVLWFVLTGLPFLALAIWPTAVGWLARILSIDYRTVQVLFLTAFLILIVFELLTIVSLQDQRISTLAQIVGIMMQKQGMSDRPRAGGSLDDSTSSLPRHGVSTIHNSNTPVSSNSASNVPISNAAISTEEARH